MVKCNICGKEYKNIQPLSKHISSYHNFDKQLYYDKYMKQLNEGICLICNENDFNKYNFGKIPKPTLIHISERNYHVYGAGKLL